MRTEQEYARIFARNLTAEIKRAGMTKEHLSKVVGVSKTTVSDWTNGKGQPRLSMFFKICEVLECDPDTLAGFEKRATPQAATKLLNAYLDAPRAIQQAVDGLLYPYMGEDVSSSVSLA